MEPDKKCQVTLHLIEKSKDIEKSSFSFMFSIETKCTDSVFSNHPPPFFILFPVFLVHLLLSLILPVGASFIQESTSQGLCGLKIVPEERIKSLLCILNVSERSKPQSSASVDKDTFILIILVNSHSITLISYYMKKCIWFLLCLTKDTFFSKE